MKAKVVRDRQTSRSRGYGFVSFKSVDDFIQAMREVNGNIFIECERIRLEFF